MNTTLVAKTPATYQLGFISTFLTREFEQHPEAKLYALGHRTLEGGNENVLQRKLAKGLDAAKARKRLEEIAQEFYEHAHQQIQNHSLPQTYVVCLLARDGRTAIAETEFTLTPPMGNYIGNLTEGPSDIGKRAQEMRLLEGAFRFGVGGVERSSDLVHDVAKDVRAENKELRELVKGLFGQLQTQAQEHLAKTMATATLLEDLMSQKLQRELIQEAARARMKHLDQAWAQVESIFKLLLKRNGVELPSLGAGAGGSPLENLHKLFKSLSTEQKVQIVNVLNEEQTGLFADAAKGLEAMGMGLAS